MSYQDYEWYIESDLSMYSGEWIIIKDKKVISHGKDVQTMVKTFRQKYPKKTPFITKIVKNKLRIL